LKATLEIKGMHCDACVRRVEEALKKVEGVSNPEVKIGEAKAEFDSARVSPQVLAQAIAQAGYQVRVQEAVEG
jgi:copper chaperone CopZ